MVPSQLPVDHWHEVILDPTIAAAVLDRLVHTAHRLALDGETLRKPPEKSAKRGKLDTDNAEGAIEAVDGSRCPRSSECCPQSIGITVRNQSEHPSAIAGIRIQGQIGLNESGDDGAIGPLCRQHQMNAGSPALCGNACDQVFEFFPL